MWLSPKRTLLQCIDFFMSDIASPSDFATGEGQFFDRDAVGKRRCATRSVHLLGNLFENQVAHSDWVFIVICGPHLRILFWTLWGKLQGDDLDWM